MKMRINQEVFLFFFPAMYQLFLYYFFHIMSRKYLVFYARNYFLFCLLLVLEATDIFDYFNLVIKVNILILVRVIKEMTTMQSTGENHAQQIR